MAPSSISNSFYLYLWRSPNSPGTLYLAQGFETAEALCRGLTDDGYIVKVIHMASDTEFELCGGRLCPTTSGSSSPGPSNQGPTNQGPTNQGPTNQGMSPSFA